MGFWDCFEGYHEIEKLVFSEVVLCVATNSRYTGVAVNSASVEWVVASHQR
jgi:hypothetical protein